jgi:hypothetical protein
MDQKLEPIDVSTVRSMRGHAGSAWIECESSREGDHLSRRGIELFLEQYSIKDCIELDMAVLINGDLIKGTEEDGTWNLTFA